MYTCMNAQVSQNQQLYILSLGNDGVTSLRVQADRPAQASVFFSCWVESLKVLHGLSKLGIQA